jgi:hypothetical protein
MPVNAGTLWLRKELVSTAPAESPEIQFVGVLGEVFYMRARNQTCTFIIQVQAFGDQWDDVAEGTLLAGELMAVSVEYYMPKARVIVTPVAAPGPVYVDISAYGYPAVYVRA